MIVEELAAKLGLDVDAPSFAKGDAAISSLRLGFGALAALATAVGGGLLAMAKSTATAAVEVTHAAQRAGATRDAFQELSFAADQSGVSAETFEHSLVLLSRTAYGAAEGSKELGQTFRDLGVGITGANGQIRPTDQILGDLAEKFSKMPDGIRKTALATRAFGRGGAELLPLLNKGRAGIAELREEAYAYGVVLDDSVIEASLRWQKQQKHLNAALTGLKYAIGGALLKTMGDMTDRIAHWVAANRELIATKVMDFLAALKQLAEPLVKIIDAVFIKTDAWKYSLIALAAILALINLPLLAIVGALLLIEDFYGFLNGKDSLIGAMFPPAAQKEIIAWTQTIRDFLKFLFSGEAFKPPPWFEKLLGLGAQNSAAASARPATAAEAGGARPVGSFTPAERFGDDKLKAFAHMLFGAGDLEKGISYAPAGPPTALAPGQANRTFSVQQTINAPPGADPKEIADRATQAFRDFHDAKMREAYSAVDQ